MGVSYKQSRQEYSPINCITYRLPSKMDFASLTLTEECMEVYDDIGTVIKEEGLLWAVFKLENVRDVVVEKTGDMNSSYEDYLTALTGEKQSRFGLFMYTFKTDEAIIEHKLLLMEWIDEDFRGNFIYTSLFKTLEQKWPGVNKTIRTSIASELEHGALEKFFR